VSGGLLVIGFGNPDCGDDDAGPRTARLLMGRMPAGRVLERHADALGLIDEWRGVGALVVIDAAMAMGRPGHLHRRDIARGDLPRELAFGSTHAFGLPEAVALARRLGRLPARAWVFAIEGADFTPGAAMTPAVTAAVERLAGRLTLESGRRRCHLSG
jgi:hydrogenase maturation protease